MTYTNLILFAFGLGGVLLHNLIKLNAINRENKGIINIGKYWALERFSIMIAIIAVVLAVVARNEIAQLEKVKEWLGGAFVAIGYMAQSIIVAWFGKAQKYIDKQTDNT